METILPRVTKGEKSTKSESTNKGVKGNASRESKNSSRSEYNKGRTRKRN